MKVFLSIVLLGVIILPSIQAWSFENPLKKPLQPSQKNESNPDIVVPVNTTLYQKYVCLNNKDGTQLIVPGSCSSYYLCNSNVATVKSCKNTTPYYEPVSKTCVSKSTCEDREILIPGGPAGCQGLCCGKQTGLYVDPTNKTRFYFCDKHVGILHACCGGEQFNPITKACDVPANCP
ncbi:uncharacterized protein LOC129920005 [Episyrphus balteatus]|uniref:uncharacterized protein LOC129920005 n=1 Tax=Episyrphus balteatus TaxID=286459 RepID=UPI002485B7DB|nr:uncharacterized protein LOC129920005 [Episyrphus balteatus]